MNDLSNYNTCMYTVNNKMVKLFYWVDNSHPFYENQLCMVVGWNESL